MSILSALITTAEDGTWICSGVHWSRLTDLTRDMCTPRFRWIPAHLIQINTPRFQEAHRGPVQREEECLIPLISSCSSMRWLFPVDLGLHMECKKNVQTTTKSRVCVCQTAAPERISLSLLHNHCIHRTPTLKYTFLNLQVRTTYFSKHLTQHYSHNTIPWTTQEFGSWMQFWFIFEVITVIAAFSHWIRA